MDRGEVGESQAANEFPVLNAEALLTATLLRRHGKVFFCLTGLLISEYFPSLPVS